MKQKGFTLVELLVVMVILGIITAISIPLVRNVRQSSSDKEYDTYMKSLKYGAKLYVDSYEEDLFGNEDSGCAIISYHDLKEKSLVKDFNKDGISCDTDDTFVRVVKNNKDYGYAVSIGCGKKADDGEVNVTYKNPKGGIGSIETCGVDATAIMTFSTDITNPNSFKYKNRSMKVIISSNTGIAGDPLIQYGFSEVEDGTTISHWEPLTINPESVDKQNNKILQGMTITATSSQISTPTGLTGKYYLILRVDRLKDPHGVNWASEGNSNYVYLGPYTLDNTKPDFQNSSIISSNTSYNDLKPKLDLQVKDELSADDEGSAKERLKMCVSFSTDSCGKNKNAFANYESYDPNKVLDKIKESLDGSKNKVFVTVVDPANNYRTNEFSYELASVITYNGNGNTGGSTSKTICNNNTDCPLRSNGFERTGYEFAGWYSAASGGIKYEATVQLSGNLNVYAHWNKKQYTITFHGNGNTSGSTDMKTCDFDSDCVLTANGFNKTGYNFIGWATSASGPKAYNNQATVRNLASSGNVDLYAVWEKKKCEFTWTTFTEISNSPCWRPRTAVIGKTAPFDASQCKTISIHLNYQSDYNCHDDDGCWGGQYYAFSIVVKNASTNAEIKRDGSPDFGRGMWRWETDRTLDLSSVSPSQLTNVYLQIDAGADCTDVNSQRYGFFSNYRTKSEFRYRSVGTSDSQIWWGGAPGNWSLRDNSNNFYSVTLR